MAYLYIDDGFPESEDYESNYIYFDGNNQQCIDQIIQLAQILAKMPSYQRRTMMRQLLANRNCDNPVGQFCPKANKKVQTNITYP